MSYPFRGNISGTVLSEGQSLPMIIDYFSLVNNTGGTIGVNVYLVSATEEISITPVDLQIADSKMYEGTGKVVMLKNDQIKIVSTGDCDYNFTINNMMIP